MSKQEITYEEFLADVHPMNLEFVESVTDFLTANNCKVEIKPAARSLVLSGVHSKTKKTVFNYVFRKSGMICRIYADNLQNYPEVIDSLPDNLKKSIAASPVCKRLVDPSDCSSRCSKGYTLNIDGDDYKKCRYNCFMLPVNPESSPHIKRLIEKEIESRNI